MAYSKARVERELEKYAHILGGMDEKGNEHRLHRDLKLWPAVRNQQLFAVRGTDVENPYWDFVLGEDALNKIKQDRWQIIYIGKARDCLLKKADGTAQIRNKKYLEYAKKQVDDLIAGERARHDRMMIAYEDSYYSDKAKQLKKELDEKLIDKE